MILFAIALGWGGYATAFWGYSLIKGYNLSVGQIMSPTSYYKGTWPPAQVSDTVIIPTKNSPTQAAGGGTSNPAPTNGACPPGYTYNPATKTCTPPEAM